MNSNYENGNLMALNEVLISKKRKKIYVIRSKNAFDHSKG